MYRVGKRLLVGAGLLVGRRGLARANARANPQKTPAPTSRRLHHLL